MYLLLDESQLQIACVTTELVVYLSTTTVVLVGRKKQ